MAESKNAEMDLAAFRDDLAALKHDVASLIEHVKGGATDKVHNAAERIDREARGFCREAGAEGERSAKAIGAWVEKQPVLALLIALGVGYVGARAFLR
jgi:cytochrome c-type biogenesis protein CcmH/NrfG